MKLCRWNIFDKINDRLEQIIQNQVVINEKIDKIATISYTNQQNISNIIYGLNEQNKIIINLQNKMNDIEILVNNIDLKNSDEQIQELTNQINDLKDQFTQWKFYSSIDY